MYDIMTQTYLRLEARRTQTGESSYHSEHKAY